jgi:hypothetical protein
MHRKEESCLENKPEWVGTKYQFYPLTEAIIIGVVSFCAIFLTTYFIYVQTLNAQKGEIREGLLRTGAVCAAFVDGDGHGQFISQDQEQTAAYTRALQPLKNTLHADSTIAYVYTLVMKNDKVFFIHDPTPAGVKGPDGIETKSHIMEPYPEASPVLIRALKEHIRIAEQEPYKDRWGSFLSAYIPVYDSHHQFVSILAIDIRADNYFKRLEPIKRATIRAMVTAFFVSFLIAALVWFMRNFSKTMNNSRHKIYEDYIRLKNGDHL